MTEPNKGRPDLGEIRAHLDCIGLGQRIDPEEWFRSTVPEVYGVNAGLAYPGCGFLGDKTNQSSTSTTTTSNDLNSASIPPGTFEIFRGICVELETGDLVEQVTLRIVRAGVTREIFREGIVGGGALGAQFLWGAPNVATPAVNSLFPFIMNGNAFDDHISVRLQSAGSVLHNNRAVFITSRYSKQALGIG